MPAGVSWATRGAPLLVVATSARALAHSALRGGWRPWVIDAFGDRDTRASAEACAVVRQGKHGFDAAELEEAIAGFAAGAEQCALIYGSGLHAPALARLARTHRVLGNEPSVLYLVRQPRAFFALLDALRIPHPQVRYSRAGLHGAWLVKSPHAEGGTRVRPLQSDETVEAGEYFQQHIAGLPASVLFLADGRAARVLGFNTQLTAHGSGGRGFLYGGAINRAPLSPRVRGEVRAAVAALVHTLRLRGLNGLDFIAAGERWWALELNARPTATAQLYDADCAQGLVAWHAAACAGRLPPAWVPGKVRAHAIVYAPAPLGISPALCWPAWCADIPAPGTRFLAGQPICSVQAEGRRVAEVRSLLGARHTAVLRHLAARRRYA